MSDSLPITVVIPARNSGRELGTCLSAIQAFSRVIIVESGDVNATHKLAAPFGAEVIPFQWDGKFPKKRNWYLRNHPPTTPWVLFLDSDEIVTPEFIQELRERLPTAIENGFWLNFTNYFMGQPLRHGDPFRKLALFRVGAGEYERIEEDSWSHLDMEVHEHPVIEGEIGEIQAPIDHRDFRGMAHWVSKHNAYSDWEAHRYMRLVKEGKTEWDKLTPRQRTKYRNLTRWWFAPAYFCASYFLKKGFLDGVAGFRLALLKAWYFYLIRLKITEMTTKQSSGE